MLSLRSSERGSKRMCTPAPPWISFTLWCSSGDGKDANERRVIRKRCGSDEKKYCLIEIVTKNLQREKVLVTVINRLPS